MGTLKEKLEEFGKHIIEQKINEFTDKTESQQQQLLQKLQMEFIKLAPAFLCGGYIKVRDDYRIYIRTVEFYFHSENENGIHDPIVYHRNNRYIVGNVPVPYFPMMSFHAHASGFDITFESEDEHYRASALIRAYEIWDIRQKSYLVYDKTIKKFRKSKDNESIMNVQSTYLYDFLNGFGKDGIVWEDESQYRTCKLKQTHRKGVYESTNADNYDPKIKDGHKILDKQRLWSFTREEQI